MKLRLFPVARDKVNGYTISTVKLSTGYETAVKLENYNWIVVNVSSTFEQAKMHHNEWCWKCTESPLYAVDVRTGEKVLF